jgi:hypothetical protein
MLGLVQAYLWQTTVSLLWFFCDIRPSFSARAKNRLWLQKVGWCSDYVHVALERILVDLVISKLVFTYRQNCVQVVSLHWAFSKLFVEFSKTVRLWLLPNILERFSSLQQWNLHRDWGDALKFTIEAIIRIVRYNILLGLLFIYWGLSLAT